MHWYHEFLKYALILFGKRPIFKNCSSHVPIDNVAPGKWEMASIVFVLEISESRETKFWMCHYLSLTTR